MGHFMKGIYSLKKVEDIKLAPSRFCDEMVRVYNGIFQKARGGHRLNVDIAERKKADRSAYLMRYLKRFCTNPDILQYYNVYAGTSGSDAPDVVLDKHKNPTGNQFDLGRDG